MAGLPDRRGTYDVTEKLASRKSNWQADRCMNRTGGRSSMASVCASKQRAALHHGQPLRRQAWASRRRRRRPPVSGQGGKMAMLGSGGGGGLNWCAAT